ncbi:class I SAM-dependent methyltransferase [Mesorhizobium loti]|uniref:class I SAM-dependent methyltransferase n=1 Tax=Rhizobium loti TaxID=381 RepID=UPI00042055B5|nr:methyltransferase domain-containing protein [Mesorhizobium loti]
MLLLGVTPEFARIGKTMTAVDAGAHMIGALWIGDSDDRRAVVGNWLSLPLANRSIDAAVGDGCLAAVTGSQARLGVLREIARVLKPNGRAAIRLFARPEKSEDIGDIDADVRAGRVSEISELILRIALWLPAEAPDYARKMNDVLDKIDEMYPDREKLLAVTGWEPDVFNLIELYRGAQTVCTWPPEQDSIDEASTFFKDVKLVSSGNYRCSERCPLLVLAGVR